MILRRTSRPHTFRTGTTPLVNRLIPLSEQLQYVPTSCTGAADRGTKKIVELFKCYSDNLGDEAVWSSFQSVIVKVTGTTPRPRAAIDSSAHPLAVTCIFLLVFDC